MQIWRRSSLKVKSAVLSFHGKNKVYLVLNWFGMNENLNISAFHMYSSFLETTRKHLQFKSASYLEYMVQHIFPGGPIKGKVGE